MQLGFGLKAYKAGSTIVMSISAATLQYMCFEVVRKTAIFNLLKIYTFDLNARLWFSEIDLIPLAEYCHI